MSKITNFSNRMRLVSAFDRATVMVQESGEGSKGNVAAEKSEPSPEVQAAYKTGWADCERNLNRKLDEMQVRLQRETTALQKRIQLLETELPASLGQYFLALENQIREEVVGLAFKVAETIISAEISKRDILRDIVQDAVAPLAHIRGVRIRLNPSIAEATKRGETEYGIPPGVEIVGDAGIGLGEVMVESPQGFVDATLPNRLAILKEKLLHVMSEEEGVEHV
jgi:flagellar biosynthesis/type III secretory pathway protein FliH